MLSWVLIGVALWGLSYSALLSPSAMNHLAGIESDLLATVLLLVLVWLLAAALSVAGFFAWVLGAPFAFVFFYHLARTLPHREPSLT